ncbi:MAG: sigma-70 family RNA polymerase sigma factor [Sedimentisphaerales bacterium]|nr:sigma-70 family RNA polymerase sigma factor [Sedimentisphaerales bacterium]
MIQDKWLILKFRHGSREAYCCIYETYRDDMLKVAVSLLKEKSWAEDIVHEVFVNLIQTRKTFKLTDRLRAYLVTCVANRARNANRDGHQMIAVDSDDCVLVSHHRRPEQWAVCSEEFEMLRLALLELPFDQREVVTLHIHGQMTFKEIAKYFECSIKTVQSRYRYALDKLRVLLNGEVQK